MKFRIIACVALWLAFCAFGIALHHVAEKGPRVPDRTWVSVAGLDSEGYVLNYGCIGRAFDFRPRHPCASVIMLPVYAIGSRMAFDGHAEMVPPFVLAVFALFAALSVFLLWHVAEDAASVALHLSFAYAWILSGTADLFTVSETVLLAVLVMVAAKVRDWRAWLGISALAGGVTVTNGVKPLLAAFMAGNLSRGSLRKCVLVAVGGVVTLSAIVVMAKLLMSKGGIMAPLCSSWNEILDVLPRDASFLDRLNMFWQSFICEPLLLHGTIIGVDNFFHGYGSPIPHVLAAVLLALAVFGAVRGWRDSVVRAALAMVSVDFILHGLIGWGAAEGQIYCGHWFFVIPILISRLPGVVWKLILASGFAAWNIRAVLLLT